MPQSHLRGSPEGFPKGIPVSDHNRADAHNSGLRQGIRRKPAGYAGGKTGQIHFSQWQESVLRHCRGAESSARYRQMGTTQVTLSLETMEAVGLAGTAQARCVCARSVAYQEVGLRPVAAVQDAGADDRVTIALLHQTGTTESCTTVGIQFVEPPDT
jgi:hypothetical protein